MSELTDHLDAIQARVDGATPGPWHLDRELPGDVPSLVAYAHNDGVTIATYVADMIEEEADAEFIANAPTDIQDLLDLARKQQAAIEAVGALHKRDHKDVEPWAKGYRYTGDHCAHDGESWPCTTMEALEAKP